MNSFSIENYLTTLLKMKPADVSDTLIHDLRNRVNSIVNTIPLIKGAHDTNLTVEAQKSLIDAIEKAAQDASNIIEAYAEYQNQRRD